MWFAIHSTLRPLCAMVLQSLEKRGVPGSTKQLSNLEKEGMKFRVGFGFIRAGLRLRLGRVGCWLGWVGTGLVFGWS